MNNLYRESKNAVDKVFFHFWKKIIKRYANNSFSRIWVFLFDVVMVLVAFWFSRLVFRTMEIPSGHTLHVLAYLLILVGVYSISFLAFNTFKGMLRYSGFGDIRRILLSSVISLCLLCGSRFILSLRYEEGADLFFPQYA
ncbi:MAG: hypothetical protein J6X35_00875, partial [Bacteroidales bacterium]|nr:hypothetical protein [Bacteroidales bacterium]